MTNKNEKEFLWPIRIYYEDTDAGGIVYHTNYIKFMERARTEWLRDLGFEQDELRHKDGVIFAVRSVQVDYFLPAKFNDELTISSKVINFGKASITIEQEVVRVSSDISKKDELLCKGIIKVATLDAALFRPKAMPTHLYEKL
ncbi:MAG: tol-pal system-associated acyl-CoA thioesterase [Gammaproteobacteria bacterium]|nr:MAG: tol-pal system-associated acyl-CoA thioesterase [Gammaproteobacteria bacterium]